MKTYIYAAFVLALYVLSFFLLWKGSPWETTVFIMAVLATALGIWVESRGWEMIFDWISNQIDAHITKK